MPAGDEAGPRLGVIDVGRAWFKGSVWTPGSPPRAVWRRDVASGDFVEQDDTARLIAALEELAGEVRSRCDRLLGYGAAQLRDPHWRARLLPVLERLCDRARVLSTEEEGLLLLRAARSAGLDATHLMDIGGGSVQLVTADSVMSWEIGTFTLETQFGLVQGSPKQRYEDVAAHLFDTVTMPAAPGTSLVIGTKPQLQELLTALAARLGVATPDCWTVDGIEQAWRYCSELDPAEFPALLPGLPAFMRGADKALLVAWVVATKLGAASVAATDASVMQGVAAEHFESPRPA